MVGTTTGSKLPTIGWKSRLHKAFPHSRHDIMAKPTRLIEATPELKGKEAIEFLRRMAKKENGKITKKELKIFKDIMELDGKPRCLHCGKQMFNIKDHKTGKINIYHWACECEEYPKGIKIGRG